MNSTEKIDYLFAVVVEENGFQRPSIFIGNPEFRSLEYLAGGHLMSSRAVADEIAKVRSVLSGELEEYVFGSADFCVLKVEKNQTTYSDNFQHNESFKISSKVVLDLLSGWMEFLFKYESNEIPGLQTTN